MEPFFLAPQGAAARRCFCIHHAPTPASGGVRGAILYVHPFAEEMNKARRMASMQSRAMAARGFAVLQIDLTGCGDSSGDFGDASWAVWNADVCAAAGWLRSRYPGPLWLWGLRAGCLLACVAAKHLGEHCNFLFWQPPSSGKALLQQFLRLRTVGQVLEGRADGGVNELKAMLASGKNVDVAGYMLAPELAMGLEQARLAPPATVSAALWFEVNSREGAAILPATEAAATAWRLAGTAPVARVVPGPPFWQTQEIEDAPSLIQATLDALDEQAVAIQ